MKTADGLESGGTTWNAMRFQPGASGMVYPTVWTTNLWTYAGTCGYAIDDNSFAPHPKLGFPSECNTPRFRMLCNIGPQIIPPPNAEVYSISPTLPPLEPPIPDPLFALGREGIAASRDFRMVVGPLAWSWNLIQE